MDDSSTSNTAVNAADLSEPEDFSLNSDRSENASIRLPHLEEHGQNIAESHRAYGLLKQRDDHHQLDTRMRESSQLLLRAYENFTESVRVDAAMASDAEWILDNFYIVEEQLREIQEDLPRKFYRELPKLAAGPLVGFPRVYALATELLNYIDSALDDETIARFVRAYQTIQSLTIGEVWAVPIMLRVGLIENLSRLAEQALENRRYEQLAETLLETWNRTEQLPLAEALATYGPGLVAPLYQQIRDREPESDRCLDTLTHQLTQQCIDLEPLVREQQQRQAADQVAIGNVITSMRLISALDWALFFEHTSLVEELLRRDPSEHYSRMDFETRDRYRHVVEDLAKLSPVTELDVARAALELAAENDSELSQAAGTKRNHVGYWLVGPGRLELERRLGTKIPVREQCTRALRKQPYPIYLGSITALTVTGVGLAFVYCWLLGAGWGMLLLVALLTVVPISELAVSLVNYLVTLNVMPSILPKLEFKDRIPPDCQTIVVVPTLLSSEADARAQVERLELHYLANPEPGMIFALVSDLLDAPQEFQPQDERIVTSAVAGIRRLNARYRGPHGQKLFLLLHRRRCWNESQQQWMGWERKRGKLLELNRLLRGATDTTFQTIEGDTSQFSSTRYVITLDSDTKLPHGTAKRLIGTLAHPLNQAEIDSEGLITRGYSVLQPRIGADLVNANRSPYASICTSSPGWDPYSTAVSDVYQDLFCEGSYTGKGIYDIDAFEHATSGVFPDNHILSHDLIEGCHGRVGLVTDIELIDNCPTRYDADARRQHRWARGDWQLLPWLARYVPEPLGKRRNPLSLLSRWKIFDNLRRSLVPPALVALLLCGWLVLPGAAWVWTALALLVLAFPLLSQAGTMFVHWLRDIARSHTSQIAWSDLGRSAAQFLLSVVLLPQRAVSMVDAIARTLWRMKVSHRHLLEWESAAATERRLGQGLAVPWRQTAGWAVFSFAVLSVLPWNRWPLALPWLIAWMLSPLVAFRISQSYRRINRQLAADDRKELRRLARKTWAFFEVFVGPEDHFLPPDNYQEYPEPKLAHRVSPTNEGLYLTSVLTAREFGYVGLHQLIILYEQNLTSLEKLARFRGHFYNWYETTTLEPLIPRYVSTVDSGNLAACMLTVHKALNTLQHERWHGELQRRGLIDSVRMVEEAVQRLHPAGARFVSDPLTELEQAIGSLHSHLVGSHGLLEWWRACNLAYDETLRLPKLQQQVRSAFRLTSHELMRKIDLLLSHFAHTRNDLQSLLPWLSVVDAALSPVDSTSHASAQTLNAAPSVRWFNSNDSLRETWQAVWKQLVAAETVAALQTLPRNVASGLGELEHLLDPRENSAEARAWLEQLTEAIESGSQTAEALGGQFAQLSARFEDIASGMNFGFLFNPSRKLFAIGFNREEGRLDHSHYDMLASEARIASFLAIAKGDVDYRHWFHLGRSLTKTGGAKALLSWGGSMFEYLMPLLFMRNYEGSLLEETCRAAVRRQMEYGIKHDIPWGISESAFGELNAAADYHYRSFGVPGLGLKRGLAKDLVVAPYATLLATMIDPQSAMDNCRALVREGADASWGFYDAIDFTSDRVPAGKRSVIVRCYMAHHQGMSLMAIANCLLNQRMQHYFHSHPFAQAAELLLQERVPLEAPVVRPHVDEVAAVQIVRELEGPVSRRIHTPSTAHPLTHLLSNGQYTVMASSAGGGFSSCKEVALTRWRSDITRDDWGQFIYLRDISSGAFWSATFQPTRRKPDQYEVVFSVDKVEFRRSDDRIESHLEIVVSPENNAEARQITLTNLGRTARDIELTSYAEIVLAAAKTDQAHPAFSKLFIETEFIEHSHALLAKRRPRDAQAPEHWAVHVLAIHRPLRGIVEYETDRSRFLGRGGNVSHPAAMVSEHLSGTTGPVLDPIFSLRHHLRLAPGEKASVAFVTASADSRDEALLLADRYSEPRVVQRTFELAWAHVQLELRNLHLSASNVHLYQKLAAHLLYPEAGRRGNAELIATNRQGQSGLWRYGISGDFPIVLVRVSQLRESRLVRELLQAGDYWFTHGLRADLVILNEHPGSYLDPLQDELQQLISETSRRHAQRPACAFLLRSSQLSADDLALLEAVASVSLHCDRGSLGRQLEAVPETETHTQAAPLPPVHEHQNFVGKAKPVVPSSAPLESVSELILTGPYGGFLPDGREYVLTLQAGQWTPMPWSNVVANPNFGFLVTEAGGGYTWAVNSRENKLTGWSNDPVSDAPSEVLWLRDTATGESWSPTPLPLRENTPYRIHHGQGYSRFYHDSHGIEHELLLSIAPEDRVKFICLKLHNRSNIGRKLSVGYYADLVLGVSRNDTHLHVQTEIAPTSGALLAHNPYQSDFGNQAVFLITLERSQTVTGDREEFFGRNGEWESAAALARGTLSGRVGVALDPCGAIQTEIVLAPDEQTEVIFLLGQVDRPEQLGEVLARYRTAQQVHTAIDQTVRQWNEILTAVEVQTPDPAFNVLVNRWLVYQVLSCRLWGRSAYYQSGGAYGFRDQLQDVMALAYARPDLTRQHILRAAAHQFEPGDVQHWWHPPLDRGVRTRFSDDFLWLPYVVAHYLKVTGDAGILDERLPYLVSPVLEPLEEERYEQPQISSTQGSLYEHCLRSIEHGFRFGAHGLPLMGTGDWNDGMNKVGHLGQGESVWVGWFLITVIERFVPWVESRGDAERAAHYRQQAQAVREAIEANAWDGHWYRRAYFDDGTPLGSQTNDECQIDSLPQSWAVIAGGDASRAREALESALARLVRRDDRLIQLLDPPFDKSDLDPGYIKGYLPGIRENGGQYTHAAFWLIEALTRLREGTRAAELFALLNPIQTSSDPQRAEIYKVEPYVVAADVYGMPPHTGRGGWTWYTGSAAWMYRAAVECLLGLKIRGNQVQIAPCIPADWEHFELRYRTGNTTYEFRIENPSHVQSGILHVELDGQKLPASDIPLVDDGNVHQVKVVLG